MKLVPYPEYKESGQPFLGAIPAHWDLFRNGRLFSQRNETGFGELPILEVSLKTGVRVRDMENLKRKQMMSDREKYKRAARGDIAYNMMRMWQGAVGVAPVDGLVSPAYVVARPFPGVDCRYFNYLFRTPSYMSEVDAYSRGIVKDRNRLYWQDFKRMPSPVPPVDEQRRIGGFLDAFNSKVRRFIRNRRQIIELLKEQKQNVINRAVARGLDPDVALKPSGVEWIGDIPKHWEAIKLRNIFRPVSSRNRPDLPLLSVVREKGVIVRDVDDLEENHNFIPDDLNNYKVVLKGQFAMNKMKAWQGSYGISEYDGIVSPAYFVFKMLEKVQLEFFHLAIRSRAYVPFFTKASDGIRTGQWDLSISRMKDIPFFIPTSDEQDKIVNFVCEQHSAIDHAISRAEREIELMREYRTRLISDVVTGRVDVRGVEAPEVLGEEPPEPDEDAGESDDVIDDGGDMDEND